VTAEPARKLAELLHADVIALTALVQFNEAVAHERIRDALWRFSETISLHNGIAHWIRGDARADLFEYIEVVYKRKRRHDYPGNISPVEFE
jgi:ethanolamine utilization protein EutA (predicted chaperonin)